MHWIALQAPPDALLSGVDPGMAQAVADAGAFRPADAATALGWWALQFTPKVAQLGQALLLEVSASERLFGGRELLVAHVLAAERPVDAVDRKSVV